MAIGQARYVRRWATAGALAAIAVTGFAPSASALDFTLGDIKGRFDTTITLGAAMRTSGQDPNLVGVVNGGRAASINDDNGDLNFNAGDLTSLAALAVHELSLKDGDFELFARVDYFYDYINHDKTLRHVQLTPDAKYWAGGRFELFDLYLADKFDLDNHPLKVRLGQQVLNWGESTFIQNGISVINPFDVTKLRTAGSELRQAVLPIPAVQASLGLTDTISFEAFYQAFWRKTQLEASGTFFSTSDFAGPGGQNVFLRFGQPPGPLDNPPRLSIPPVGSIVNRAPDRKANDGGQFGVALRALVPSLADTEFGAYFVKYNSRTPIVSGNTGTLAGLAVLHDYASTASYFFEYPNDIKMVGGSFNTNLASVAIQGEFSHHWDQPIQVDDVELLFAALSPIDPFLGLPLPPGTPVFGQSQLGRYGFSQEVSGYRRKSYDQFQFTLTKAIPNVLKMDQLVLIGEAGFMWVNGMEPTSVLRYEGPGTFTSANPFFTTLGIQPSTEDINHFATPFSWGYRLAARGEIDNAIGAVTLQPTIAFNHDVSGISPAPISNFVEGKKSLTLGLGFSYLNRWQGNIAYTNFWGGGRYNLLRDRDFVSLSVSYSF